MRKAVNKFYQHTFNDRDMVSKHDECIMLKSRQSGNIKSVFYCTASQQSIYFTISSESHGLGLEYKNLTLQIVHLKFEKGAIIL